MTRILSACLIAGLFTYGGATFTGSAMAQTSAKTEAKKAGEATKEAAKDTGSAAKHAGKAVAKGTKKAASKTKNVVKGAVTDNKHATCNDGTHYKGESRADACAGHGGVKVWLED